MSTKRKTIIMVLLGSVLLITVVVLNGCKKEEPTTPEEVAEKAISAITEQTVCPVMRGKIDKDIFIEYKGKKVYFCCPGCKPKFEKNPQKYINKLPQFQN